MKHKLLLKNLFWGMTAVFLVLSLFSAVLYGAASTELTRESHRELEQSTLHIRQSVSNLIRLTNQDFEDMVSSHGTLLWETLTSEHRASGTTLFLSDHRGKIQMSTQASLWDQNLSAAALTLASENQGSLFFSDLDGLLEEECALRVVVLEQGKQTVGYVWLAKTEAPDSALLSLSRGLLIATGCLSGIVAAAAFFLSRRILSPLTRLDETARAFRHGDFSARVEEKKCGSLGKLATTFNEMAERAEKSEAITETFLSNVSHDLRTPLTTIGGFIQNLKEGAIPPEESAHYYEIVLSEVDRLSRMVKTFLDSSRSASGNRPLKLGAVDLCELSCVTLLSFEKRAEEKRLHVDFSCERDYIFVQADEDAIHQVLYNLMDNAIKFTPEEGRITVRVEIREKKALFSIENTGEGIPEEELSLLFDRFFKSDRSRGLDKNGLGLGLSIAKSIVLAHKEELRVESVPGSTTKFFFPLPLTSGSKGRF